MIKIFDRYAIEEIDYYKDYRYAILLQKHGHRCAYIEVPKTNKYYDVYPNKINKDDLIDVHGGFTFGHCGEYNISDGEKKYYPIDVPNTSYWLGWDYGHCDDAVDIETVKKYWGDTDKPYVHMLESIYEQDVQLECHLYTKEEVSHDCKKAIDELIKYEKIDVSKYCEGCENLVKDTDFDMKYCDISKERID